MFVLRGDGNGIRLVEIAQPHFTGPFTTQIQPHGL